MIEYSAQDLITRLREVFKYYYPDAQFLNEELEGVVIGLVNSIRWTALRAAREVANQEQQPDENGKITFTGSLEIIETEDHFSSKWMSREEILYRIENTTGLPPDLSANALSIIEQVLDRALVVGREEVNVSPLGRIRAAELPEGSQVALPRPEITIAMDELISLTPDVTRRTPYIMQLAEGLSIKSSGRGNSRTQAASGGAASAAGASY